MERDRHGESRHACHRPRSHLWRPFDSLSLSACAAWVERTSLPPVSQGCDAGLEECDAITKPMPEADQLLKACWSLECYVRLLRLLVSCRWNRRLKDANAAHIVHWNGPLKPHVRACTTRECQVLNAFVTRSQHFRVPCPLTAFCLTWSSARPHCVRLIHTASPPVSHRLHWNTICWHRRFPLLVSPKCGTTAGIISAATATTAATWSPGDCTHSPMHTVLNMKSTWLPYLPSCCSRFGPALRCIPSSPKVHIVLVQLNQAGVILTDETTRVINNIRAW
jgi:hypothetical protein